MTIIESKSKSRTKSERDETSEPLSVLFITPEVRMENASGGSIVTLERLLELAKHHNVTVLTMHADNKARKYFSTITWLIAGKRKTRSAFILLQSYLNRLPLSVWRNTSRDGLQAARQLNMKNWDLVYVDHWLMIEMAAKIKSGKRILNLHNAEPDVFFSAAKSAPFPHWLLMWNEGQRSRKYLAKAIPSFNEMHLLSKDDAEALKVRKIRHPKTHVFLPTVPYPKTEPRAFDTRRNEVLFVGTLSWHANEEGLIWYIENVIAHTDKGLRHQVVGGGANDRLHLKLKARAGLTAHGYVDDLEPFYQSARCLVAPLRSGSGIKIKIVNALARGLPVVTTPVGIEGFPPGYEAAITVADTPTNFARAVETLCHDRQAWESASANARRYFKMHFLGCQWQKWAEEPLS